MLPVYLLGDAAAAEEMVKQSTRTQRPDQTAQNEIFERRLRLAIEASRLASVQPSHAMEESDPTLHAHNSPSRKKRRRRYVPAPPPLFRDQPPAVRDDLQPLLFNIHPDPTIAEYRETDAAPEMGKLVDRMV